MHTKRERNNLRLGRTDGQTKLWEVLAFKGGHNEDTPLMFSSSPKNYGCGKNHGWETRSQLWTLGDDESSKVFKHKTSCLRSRLSTSRLTQSDLFYISLPIPFKINLMFIYKQGTVERKPLFIRPWGKWWHKEYHILNKYQVYKVYSVQWVSFLRVPGTNGTTIFDTTIFPMTYQKKHIGKYLYQVTIHSTYQRQAMCVFNGSHEAWKPWKPGVPEDFWEAPGWAASSFNWSLNLNLAWSMGIWTSFFHPLKYLELLTAPDLHHPLLVWIKQVIFSDDEQRGSNRRNETHSI